MHTNLSLMKLTIRMILLMIFFVMIYLLTAVVYSSKYWPDIHRYINGNITIKHIPTVTELNLTVIEVEYTTELYTEADYDSSTFANLEIDIDEFTNIQAIIQDPKRKTKRDAKLERFESDYSELATRSVVVDYLFLEDPTDVEEGLVWKKIVKDLIDESKLVPKNLEEIEMVDRNGARLQKLTNICHGNTSAVSTIFPWIATIFIKNDTNHYQYICDGAILSENLLITAGRCVISFNTTVEPDDVLVFLGKRSLQNVGEHEKNARISQIIIHDGFLNAETVANDLALLMLEEPVVFSGGIRPACVGDGEDLKTAVKSATTAWDLKGDLTPVFFEKTDGGDCTEKNDGTFCATYGNEVALCPSYGGVFATKHASRWSLHGLRSGDTTDRGLCFSKNVQYTPLTEYRDWIQGYMK